MIFRGCGGSLRRGAVALEIGDYEAVLRDEPGSDQMPDVVGLWEAVDEEERGLG